MPGKDKKEGALFTKGLNIRTGFIGQLDKCKTLDGLQGILSRFAEAQKKPNYKKSKFTPSQKQEINQLEKQIERLIHEKQDELAKEEEQAELV